MPVELAAGGLDGVADAALGVVGVDQHDRVVGEGARRTRRTLRARSPADGSPSLLGGLHEEVIHGAGVGTP